MIPYINIHTHRKPSGPDEWVVRNAGMNRGNFIPNEPGYGLSVGVHPWYAGKLSLSETMNHLAEAIQNPQVWAVGEIGLDRVKGPDFRLQTEWFEKQLELSEKNGKPAILHCVRAYSDLPKFLKKTTVSVILHGYNGNAQQTGELLKFPCIFFSLGTRTLSGRPEETREWIRRIPAERLFLETDTAKISIKDIYIRFSHVSGIPIEELKRILWENFVKVTRRSGH